MLSDRHMPAVHAVRECIRDAIAVSDVPNQSYALMEFALFWADRYLPKTQDNVQPVTCVEPTCPYCRRGQLTMLKRHRWSNATQTWEPGFTPNPLRCDYCKCDVQPSKIVWKQVTP